MQKINSTFQIITKFFKEETNKIILGRWAINYCPVSIKKKIDSGNHDHCGPCGDKPKELSGVVKPEIKKTVNPIKDLE
jgi:hypothetical protein